MATARTKIRAAMVKAIRRVTGAKVVPEAASPTWFEELPAICVYTESEVTEELNKSPKAVVRTLGVQIEIKVEGAEYEDEAGITAYEQLDDLSRCVELAMLTDDTLDCTVDVSDIKSTQYEFEANGERVIGSSRLLFELKYAEDLPADVTDQKCVDLNTIHADYHIGHHDEDPDLTEVEAEQDVDVT